MSKSAERAFGAPRVAFRFFPFTFFGRSEEAAPVPRLGATLADHHAAQPILEFREVSFDYGARRIVDDASIVVHSGRLVGLLGPNGAGKTTLLRLAAGLLRPKSGVVRLAGRNLTTMRRKEIARRIAVLPQNGQLPPAFTGQEIVLMGRTPHLGWLSAEGPTDLAIVRRALELVDAGELADRRVGELSGGERQRILLAKALAQEPDLLLLDEPTVHLDLTHQLGMLNLIRSLTRVAGLAVLGVFHEINLAAEFCDEIALLVNGKIVARDTPEAVLTPERIRQVYGVDLPVMRHPASGRPMVLLPSASREPISAPVSPASNERHERRTEEVVET